MTGFDAPEFEACSTPEATACSAVLAWQQGRMTAEDVAEAIYDVTGGDDDYTHALMAMAVDWHNELVRVARSDRRRRTAQRERNRPR